MKLVNEEDKYYERTRGRGRGSRKIILTKKKKSKKNEQFIGTVNQVYVLFVNPQ